MSNELVQLVEEFFKVIESKDIEASLVYFSDNAEFIDPHYPNIHMKGKKEIEQGLTWGFKGLKKLGFTIEKSLAVEVATAHELPNGKALNFPQAFIIEIEAGKITRLQAYEPYGPHGIFKIILAVTRFMNTMLRKS